MNKVWPKWIELRYFNPDDGGIMGYLGCANNMDMLFDNMERLNIKDSQDMILMIVNDEQQSKEAIHHFFAWMDKKREEKEEDEARKEAEQGAKTNY